MSSEALLPTHHSRQDHHHDIHIAQAPAVDLGHVLGNSIVLNHICPLLPVASILSLAGTSRALSDIIWHSPGVFRHLDLSTVKAARFQVSEPVDRGGQPWRNVQLDENLTEDEFYSGPLRGVFSTLKRRNVLGDVQTLILDGLSVTSELCHDIINGPDFNVRILSLRDCKNLNQPKLRASLQYACRSSRPAGSPRLKALYIFGQKESAAPSSSTHDTQQSTISTSWNNKSQRALSSALEGDAWWSRKGRMVGRHNHAHEAEQWTSCLQTCEGIIAFDAVLCKGPRHSSGGRAAAVATFAVPACDGCGKAPEGLVCRATLAMTPPVSLPLLSPPPIMSSSLRCATAPTPLPLSSSPTSAAGLCGAGSAAAAEAEAEGFVPRCFECLRERYCTSCNKWWCEDCYVLPGDAGGNHVVAIVDDEALEEEWNLPESPMGGVDAADAFGFKTKVRVSKSCWECGNNCDDCINATQRSCKKCRAGYCLVHNEGSCSNYCDWCHSRGRGISKTHL